MCVGGWGIFSLFTYNRQRAGTAPRGQGPQAGGGAWAGALGASLRPLGQAVAEVSVSLQEDKLAKTSF